MGDGSGYLYLELGSSMVESERVDVAWVKLCRMSKPCTSILSCFVYDMCHDELWFSIRYVTFEIHGMADLVMCPTAFMKVVCIYQLH